ncbi:50S ribosomal protein L40e [Candidatus Woesearchaeota archaeon]|nr:50S ribosomal protein L40e [Candidatus Woesearchaeota archaeon]
MVKFPESEQRFFRNTFVCKKCKAKVRAPNLKVIQGKVKCRKCKGKALRPISRK